MTQEIIKPVIESEKLKSQANPYFGDFREGMSFRGTLDDLTD